MLSQRSISTAARHPDWRVYGVVALLLVLLSISVTILMVSKERAREEERVTAALGNLSQLLADDVGNLLVRTETLIRSAENYYADTVTHGRVDPARFSAFLDKQVEQIPEAYAMLVVGPDGAPRFGSRYTQADVDFTDRAYFVKAQSSEAGKLIFDGPLVARGTLDTWVLVVSQRLDNPDGSFGGVILVALEVQAFGQRLAKPDLGPSGVAVLRTLDMAQVARSPLVESPDTRHGNRSVSSTLRDRVRRYPDGGTYRDLSAPDEEVRTNAYRLVKGYPFFVTIGRSEADYLATWRQNAWLLGARCVVIILVTLFAVHRLYVTALARSDVAERMSLAIDGASLGLWSLNVADRRVVASERCLALLGFPADARPSIGRFLEQIPSNERLCVEAAIAESVATGAAYRQEHRVLRQDGTELWISVLGRALRGQDGRVRQFHGVVQDITQRKADQLAIEASKRQLEALTASLRRANDELVRSARRYADAMDAANDGLWEANLQTGEVFISPMYSRMLGYAPGELGSTIRTAWEALLPPDEREPIVARFRQAMADTGRSELEFPLRGKDGGYRWIFSRGLLVERDADEQPLRVVGTHVDLTARKQLETELRAARALAEGADQAKTAFLRNVSHELRTPMNGIIGLTDLVLAETSDPQAREMLEEVSRAAWQLLGVIDDVLEITEIECQQITLDETEFTLAPLLARTRDELGPRAAQKGLALAVHLPADAAQLPLRGDEKRLCEVIQKLLGNAIKFTAAGGVDVRILQLEDRGAEVLLRFEVEDSGVGIAPEHFGRLFTLFEQADNSVTRRHGGLGLGLVTCKRIVQLMGGEIGVSSQLGKGSLFWFTVNLRKAGGQRRGGFQAQIASSIEI